MNREIIANVLRKLHFVNWDRYFGEGDCLTFFGWINRKDSYKDFVTLEFHGKDLGYATSSAKYTKQIAEILNMGHSKCHRVEYFCDGDNIIKEDSK